MYKAEKRRETSGTERDASVISIIPMEAIKRERPLFNYCGEYWVAFNPSIASEQEFVTTENEMRLVHLKAE
jgi:hypothetical protein